MSKIAVIGAGPMGLAAAYYLLKSGHQVDVYEADDKIGGMSASFDFDGVQIERYYHFICAQDQPLFDLLEELEIMDLLRWTDTKMGFYFQGELYPWGNPMALMTFPKLDLLSKLRYGLLAFTSTKRSDWSKLDKIDAVTWLKSWIGDKAYDVLWKSLFELKFYHFTDNLSAAWIWTRIRRVGTSRKSMMVEKMGYMQGGSETIIQRLRERIEQLGGSIYVSSPVQKILLDEDRLQGIRVNGLEHHYDQVVSTVPVPYIQAMIPDLPKPLLQQFAKLQNIAVVCILVKLKQQVTENFWLNINDASMDIPGLVEYSNLNRSSDHIVYVPYYMPADNPMYKEPDQRFFDKVKTYLFKLNKNLKEQDIIAMHASRYRFAQPICPPQFPEQLPPINLPIQGLFVADTSYYYPEDRSICESVKLAKHITHLMDDN